MSRWSTLLVDEARLADLAVIPAENVLRHADLVLDRRPTPMDLYARWESQQWSAEDLSLERDRVMRADRRIPPAVRAMLDTSIATFVVGEYTGLDMLGPILTGSPDETYSLFLGTQIADEARHTRAVFRLAEEVMELDGGPAAILAACWNMSTPAHVELSLMEAELVRDVNARPLDYGRWLRAVTLFHLITEAVLALVGQRVLVHALRGVTLFDGVKTAFSAMCRDESRHVSFGVHALRTGIQEGYSDEIYDVLERSVPLALGMESGGLATGVDFRGMGITALVRHMRLIGADPSFTEHLVRPHRTEAERPTR